jgi:hypothetical protein
VSGREIAEKASAEVTAKRLHVRMLRHYRPLRSLGPSAMQRVRDDDVAIALLKWAERELGWDAHKIASGLAFYGTQQEIRHAKSA